MIRFPDVYFGIMPKRLHLEPHLSSEELEHRYRKAKDPDLRSHLLIVWQLSLGKVTREVAASTGYSPEWIREISCRYNRQGVEGLGDRRHHNPGKEPLLSPAEQEELRQALLEPPPQGGMWSSSKVARWIEEKSGRRGVRAQRGWEYLRKLGNSPQVPSPSHAEADPKEQEAFKKSYPNG
jgi:transposase